MAKNNKDFFKKKKEWSNVKDELLSCYFKPYVSKILYTQKPLVYVDCFAGKGKFDDGNPGSPLIASNIIKNYLDSSKIRESKIEAIFIELNHADELQTNLPAYPWIKVISGKYEDNLEKILRNKLGCNVFLYIDPYGIKALKFSMFRDLAKMRFRSIELLINLNSFGFIREACSVLGTSFEDKDMFDDLVEYDESKMEKSSKSINELNLIAGGNYWQSIIHQYKDNLINGNQAEAFFVEQYCNQLKENYKFVLNMPIRIKPGYQPKYRLIHVCNHRDGCLLMVDNINKRSKNLQILQSGGQLSLFEENCENQIVNEAEIFEKVNKHFSQYNTNTSLNDVMANFFVKYGPICSTSNIKKDLRKLEKDNQIILTRIPGTTKKGKKSIFMDESKNKKIYVRWIGEKSN